MMLSDNSSGSTAAARLAAEDHTRGGVRAVPVGPVDRVLARYARRFDEGMRCATLLIFDGPAPTREQVVDHLGTRVPLWPALTCHAVRQGRRTVWRSDPAFELGDHVYEHMTPDDRLTPDGIANEIAAHPVPRESAPWRVCLVHDRSGKDGRFALALLMHHTAFDGAGGAQGVQILFGAEPPVRPIALRRPDRPSLRASELPWGLRTTLVNLRPQARISTWYARRSPTGRRVVSTVVPLARLRGLSAESGATFYQLHLAAVTAALRAWIPGPRPQHAAVPISTRPWGEAEDAGFVPGNQLALMRLRLPSDEPDPRVRLERLLQATRPQDVLRVRELEAALTYRPTAWLLALCVTHPRQSALLVNSVRMPGLLECGGRTAADVAFLPPHLPGHALTALLGSYGGRARVSFSVDTGIPDADRLPGLWLEALDELESHVGGDGSRQQDMSRIAHAAGAQ